MRKRFENKVVIVTGSGSGIGETTAIKFSEEGANVIIADINADTGNYSLEKDTYVKDRDSYLFENYQISEKNLINLSKGKINHAKILQKIYNQKKLISLEMSNIDIRLLEKDINKFQNIILSIK